MDGQDPRKYSINDFRGWHDKGELVLNPRFQRRAVWSPKARAFFVDSILRRLPVPMIYLRQQIDLATKKTIREVVDGQQRLRAVLDFLNGGFTVSKTYNAEFGGKRFSDLPEEVQHEFLKYPFAVDILEGASDADILHVFSRLNSYTVTLNDQEKLNASFFGLFKQAAYEVAFSHLTFWRNNLILSDREILRMEDARLASELLVAMLHGLQDGAKVLRGYYAKYDEQFPEGEKSKKRFDALIDQIGSMFGDGLASSPYARRLPLFYSLFCVLYDAAHGLPGSDFGPQPIPAKRQAAVASALIALAQHVDEDDPPRKYVSFVAATKQETNTIKTRSVRHKMMLQAINDTA